jgi:primosomal protein N' (replication factor Y) (superfamily II helicase)
MSRDLIASVILDKGINRPFDYCIDNSLSGKIQPSMRVLVPLGKRVVKGTVIEVKNSSPFKNLKSICELLQDNETLSADLLKLAKWMQSYYASSSAQVLRSMLPSSVRKDKDLKLIKYIKPAFSKGQMIELCQDFRAKRGKWSLIIEHILVNIEGIERSDLLKLENVSPSSLATLIKKGVLLEVEAGPFEELLNHSYLQSQEKSLNQEQQKAYENIASGIRKGGFYPHLLFGITGSGKTEVFLQLIRRTLDEGKKIILLIPEISLTAQTIERIKSRFTQEKIAILHSRLNDSEKNSAWSAMKKGQIDIVVGARSALFSPMDNIGLIIVDEEHDTSYKQQDKSPCFNARDVAIVRAKLVGASVILASATPSVESYYNAQIGKYKLSTLTIRAGGAILPKVEIIDMGADRQRSNSLFSQELLQKIEKNTANGEQSILFLNRRGSYAQKICSGCHNCLECDHCSIPLTLHKRQNILTCHVCDAKHPNEERQCKKCGFSESFTYKGPGTEQVERTLKAILPNTRVLRLDRDTTQKKDAHERIFQEFRAGKADVLIGTQMLAKGLDFPKVTLVGILSADKGLHIPDFRSNETVFSLTTQVAGRAGRSVLPGHVIIQSFLPDHPVIVKATKGDYLSFYESEVQERKLFDYPPHSRLAKITFSGKDATKSEAYARQFHKQLKNMLEPGFELFSLKPCFRFKVKDQFRFDMLIKSKKIHTLNRFTTPLMTSTPKHTRVLVDVDPTNLFS